MSGGSVGCFARVVGDLRVFGRNRQSFCAKSPRKLLCSLYLCTLTVRCVARRLSVASRGVLVAKAALVVLVFSSPPQIRPPSLRLLYCSPAAADLYSGTSDVSILPGTVQILRRRVLRRRRRFLRFRIIKWLEEAVETSGKDVPFVPDDALIG
jgi:hypothetical protein